MKRILSAFLLLLLLQNISFAQGKYAGTMKKLIGKTYADEKHISGFAGWKFMEGSLITDVNDVVSMTADIFKKGTTYIVFFSIKEDTADVNYTIAEIIEIKNVPKTQHIRTGICREGENESIEIVAFEPRQKKGGRNEQ